MKKDETEIVKLDNQLCFPIYVLAREVIKSYRPLLEELEITYPQYLVLMVLWEHQKQTVNQLGEKLALDSGTLTPLLKRLEQKEIIVRNRSKKDERIVEITLTEKGNNLRGSACRLHQEMISQMDITEEEFIELKRIVAKILKK